MRTQRVKPCRLCTRKDSRSTIFPCFAGDGAPSPFPKEVMSGKEMETTVFWAYMLFSVIGPSGRLSISGVIRCRRDRHSIPPFKRAKIVVVASGRESSGTWVTEERNLLEDYRSFFGETDKNPVSKGIGILTDADNTHSHAVGDYSAIEILRGPRRTRCQHGHGDHSQIVTNLITAGPICLYLTDLYDSTDLNVLRGFPI